MLTFSAYYWINLKQGKWGYSQETVSYTSEYVSSPGSEDCVKASISTGEWVTADCNELNLALCQDKGEYRRGKFKISFKLSTFCIDIFWCRFPNKPA